LKLALFNTIKVNK